MHGHLLPLPVPPSPWPIFTPPFILTGLLGQGMYCRALRVPYPRPWGEGRGGSHFLAWRLADAAAEGFTSGPDEERGGGSVAEGFTLVWA